MKRSSLFFFGVVLLAAASAGAWDYPPTEMKAVVEEYHGVKITDNYRWLEDAEDPAVQAWTERQEAFTQSIIGELPQKQWLVDRFNALWRYDDETTPQPVLEGDRLFYWVRKKDAEKAIYMTKEQEGAEGRVVLDPNQWEATETLAGVRPSRDGKYIAYGVAHGGDENPVYRIMVTETGEHLEDSLRGWRQNVTSWLPGNEGFYYICQPLAGEVPEGEHEYWDQVWYHKLDTGPEQDIKIFWHDEVKEYWHWVGLTEDAKYMLYNRGLFNATDVYFKPTGSDQELIPLATGMEDEYTAIIVDEKILITTNAGAPRQMVYITDVAKPERENWRVFLPEHPQDRLEDIAAIGGRIYASYTHNTFTQTKIYDLAGNHLRDLPYPTIGIGGVNGRWGRPEVWVYFSSFTYPPTVFKYHFETDELEVYHEFPVEVDVEGVVADQVWYESKDGTKIPMFVVHKEGIPRDGSHPTFLTGYGGFDVSMRPFFSSAALVWIEAGGVYAVPNLRGGGEFGRQWHEAGMLERKQNVFDDFIAAAEYLIAEGFTNPAKLAISGGSNGGLLVGAVTVQRPELFKAVLCGVPLLDMINYHKFGLANIWTEEYGNSDDPEQFKFLYAYSPYHNVRMGVKYPAFLVTGSENDARVDPLHARKMCALLQKADQGGGPIMLFVRKASGHSGGTTLSKQIEQQAEQRAFLMDQLGMQVPGR